MTSGHATRGQRPLTSPQITQTMSLTNILNPNMGNSNPNPWPTTHAQHPHPQTPLPPMISPQSRPVFGTADVEFLPQAIQRWPPGSHPPPPFCHRRDDDEYGSIAEVCIPVHLSRPGGGRRSKPRESTILICIWDKNYYYYTMVVMQRRCIVDLKKDRDQGLHWSCWNGPEDGFEDQAVGWPMKVSLNLNWYSVVGERILICQKEQKVLTAMFERRSRNANVTVIGPVRRRPAQALDPGRALERTSIAGRSQAHVGNISSEQRRVENETRPLVEISSDDGGDRITTRPTKKTRPSFPSRFRVQFRSAKEMNVESGQQQEPRPVSKVTHAKRQASSTGIPYVNNSSQRPRLGDGTTRQGKVVASSGSNYEVTGLSRKQTTNRPSTPLVRHPTLHQLAGREGFGDQQAGTIGFEDRRSGDPKFEVCPDRFQTTLCRLV